MPVISRTVSELASNLATTNQSAWFSYVRRVYSRQNGGSVLPPTKTEFTRMWSAADQNFSFMSEGENFEECRRNLQYNTFPFQSIALTIALRARFSHYLKAKVWTNMIMAFNMYAAIRKEFNMFPNNKVDFIGSTNSSISWWEPKFYNRCVLFIPDTKLDRISDLINIPGSNATQDFWRNIMEIYDAQSFIRCFHENDRLCSSTYQTPTRTNNQEINNSPGYIYAPYVTATRYVSTPEVFVDEPEHAITQECLDRIEENNNEYSALDNQQISNMILQSENSLPPEVSKMIYETCIAFHISHPAQE